jgi:hypothetical protein
VLLQSRFASQPTNRRDPRSSYGDKHPPRRLSPNTVVGSVIAVCVGIYGWQFSNVQEAKTGSLKARQALADFEKHMVMSLQNFREGRYYTILTGPSIFALYFSSLKEAEEAKEAR